MPRSLLTSTLQIRTIGFSGPTSSWSRCATTGLPRASCRARAPEGRAVGGGGPTLAAARRGQLIELSDDEAVAAAVMLPMVAADHLHASAPQATPGAPSSAMREGSSE